MDNSTVPQNRSRGKKWKTRVFKATIVPIMQVSAAALSLWLSLKKIILECAAV